MQSLGAYLKSVPASDQLIIDEPVSRDYVLSALVMELQRRDEFPIVTLNHVSETSAPIVANLFGSPARVAAMIGATEDTYVQRAMHALANPILPTMYTEGVAPCQEVVITGDDINLEQLPISEHFEDDAGRYISSAILVCRDPDDRTRNLSFQRLQLKGKNKFGVSLHSRGHIWDYHRRAEAAGKDLEVALVIGCHPAIYLAGSARVGMDVDEYDLAGALINEPIELVRCKTLDLEVPAAAEYVIEGRILADTLEPEGPFGEYTGYSSSRSTNNVFITSAITHREKPIYLDLVPGNARDHLGLGQSFKRPFVLERLRERVPQVLDLWYPKSGGNYHAYIKLAKSADGQAKQALMLLFGLDNYVKLGIVVGEDIDIRDEAEVLWAVSTKLQADRDVFVVSDVFHNRLDPSGKDGLSAKMGMDATGFFDPNEIRRIASPPAAKELALKFIDRNR